jgi:hypothetical protein
MNNMESEPIPSPMGKSLKSLRTLGQWIYLRHRNRLFILFALPLALFLLYATLSRSCLLLLFSGNIRLLSRAVAGSRVTLNVLCKIYIEANPSTNCC